MLPDLIISWPRNCDYPLWRKFLAENRWLFDNIVIVFTETNQGDDYRGFLQMVLSQIPIIKVVNSPDPLPGEDWRDVAVKFGLKNIEQPADWVFFTEQDLFITSDRFWDEVLTAENEGAEVIATLEGASRVHPCCIFIKRSVLEQTKQFFGVVPGVCDHFGQLQIDLESLNIPIHIIKRNFKHMAGLSQNMRLAYEGQIPNHKLDEFCKYLDNCLQSGEVMPAGFVRMANKVLREYAGNKV